MWTRILTPRQASVVTWALILGGLILLGGCASEEDLPRVVIEDRVTTKFTLEQTTICEQDREHPLCPEAFRDR